MTLDPKPTVGVLYPGELGAAVALLLRAAGHRVITTVEHRGSATRRRCEQLGLETVDSLEAVVRGCDVLISLVTPDAAEVVADECFDAVKSRPARLIYVDANSVGPEAIERINVAAGRAGVDFVDASINGLAVNLTRSATLFVSGARADEVGRLFEPGMRVERLGPTPGAASAMKMLLAGLSKGVCALFLELGILADSKAMLEPFMAQTRRIYPGLGELVDRMVPTYARHAVRRAVEMAELEETSARCVKTALVIPAVRAMHEALAQQTFPPAPPDGWTAAGLIQFCTENGFLAGTAPARSPMNLTRA